MKESLYFLYKLLFYKVAFIASDMNEMHALKLLKRDFSTYQRNNHVNSYR